MCGDYDSVIGMKKQPAIDRLKNSGIDVEDGKQRLAALVNEGKALPIELASSGR